MRHFFIFPAIFLFILPSFSQELKKSELAKSSGDTADTVKLKMQPDTLRTITGIDTIVTYSCKDSIVYNLSSKTMSLYRNGDIKHQQMELNSERIDVNWNTSVLHAQGIIDTNDTTGMKKIGSPVMKDGGEEYKGRELFYNFLTRKGKINVGKTEQDQGYYHGEEIKKVDKDIMFVSDGRYTTCDQDTPHYYFFSNKMKVTMQDKVIAEPVYMYISDVPVFGLPFAVFPNKSGRRSGIIPPAIVEDATHGRLLHHLGYYWAISDYMDLCTQTDLYTKGSWAAYSDFRYALRYYFYGSVGGEYRKIITGEKNDPGRTKEESYRLGILHNQDIDPTTRFNVNFTFASQNSYRNTLDMRQALDQSIISNATLSRFWEGTPNSMSLNISRRQNLIDGSIDETLPAISFNHSQSFPFRGKKSTVGTEDFAWYEMIGVNYSAYAASSRSKIKQSIYGIKTGTGSNSVVQTIEDFGRTRIYSLNQGVGLNISPKLGHFTITPSLSYSDQRSFINKDIPERAAQDSSLRFRNDQAWIRTGNLTSAISIGTKLYGITQPELLGVQALRHTFIPNLSFSYQKQIIGDNIQPKRMIMGLSLSNVFEMKTFPKKEEEEPTRIQLLNLDGDISYDFTDTLHFSPIHLSYRTGIGEALNISGGATFDMYKFQPVGNNLFNRINKFLVNEDGRLAQLTDFNINMSTSLSGEKKKSSESQTERDTSTFKEVKSGYYGVYREEEPDFNIPWRLYLTWDFSENKIYKTRSSGIRGTAEFNLTPAWKFTVGGGYDLVNKEVVVPDIRISRDLHCWVMDFSWVPIGYYRHYMFEIRIKAAQLRDIKVTKTGSPRGIY